jgi:hypothetical protein
MLKSGVCMALLPDTCVNRNAKIPWRIIEGEAILVNVGAGEVIHLNEAGACIWNFLEGKKRLKDIARHVCDNFEVDAESAMGDASEFISGLFEKEIVSICE